MWDYKILEQIQEETKLVFNVEFSNGGKSYTERIDVESVDALKGIIQNTLDSLNAVSEVVVTPDQDGKIDLTVTQPPKEELDFTADLTLLDKYNVMVSRGIFASDDPIVVNQRAKVKAVLEANPEFIKFF